MKLILNFIFILIFNFGYSQNSAVLKLWELNKSSDSILVNYQKKLNDSLSYLPKKERRKIMYEKEKKLSSIIQTQKLEILAEIKKNETEEVLTNNLKKGKDCTIVQKEINLFNKEFQPKYNQTELKHNTDKNAEKELTTIVTFVVDEGGYVSQVKANGNNKDFDTEAELLMYQNNRFMPKCENGLTTKNKFRLPIRMKLK